MKNGKGKYMKTSTVVGLVLGTVAVTGIAAYAFSAKAATPKNPGPKKSKPPKGKSPHVEVMPSQPSKNKLPSAGKPPRVPAHGGASTPGGGTVAGQKVRRPVMPDPREASWSELEDTVALLNADAQWRFAVPEERAGIFPEGEAVTMRIDTLEGMAVAEASPTSVGFNLISRIGPSVTFNRESGILQIYAGGYTGRVEIEAAGVSLSAWVLSDQALETLGSDQRSKHLVDERVDGVWQVHAFLVDEAGSAVAHESGEFLDQAAALLWADHWLEGQLAAA